MTGGNKLIEREIARRDVAMKKCFTSLSIGVLVKMRKRGGKDLKVIQCNTLLIK